MARPTGSPNKRSGLLKDRLEFMGCDPLKIAALTAMNQLECGVCRGKLKTRYKLPQGEHTQACKTANSALCVCEGIAERTCQSCYGTGMESVGPSDRLKAAAELLSYTEAKRKAIEVIGDGDGGPVGIMLQVEFKG